MNITYSHSVTEIVLDVFKVAMVRLVSGLYQAYQRHQWFQMRQRTRAQLRDLTPEQLDDVGITREEADEEMKKSYGE